MMHLMHVAFVSCDMRECSSEERVQIDALAPSDVLSKAAESALISMGWWLRRDGPVVAAICPACAPSPISKSVDAPPPDLDDSSSVPLAQDAVMPESEPFIREIKRTPPQKESAEFPLYMESPTVRQDADL